MSTLYSKNYDLTMPFVDDSAQIFLAATTDETYTVPGTTKDKFSVRFTYTEGSNVFVGLNAEATIPDSGSPVGTQAYCEFRPGCDGSQRYVKGTDVLHFITPDTTAYVGIRLMKLNQ